MRFDRDTYKEVADSLSRNRRRSILTGFGVFWGVFMLMALVGGGAGLKVLLMDNFKGFATNSAFLWADSTTKPYKGMKEGRYWSLTLNDVARLKNMIPELEVTTGVMGRWGNAAEYRKNSVSCIIKGLAPEYSEIETPAIKFGRYLNGSDCLQKRKVCVIGKRIYTSLFPGGEDPCGKTIKVGSVDYTVVGVNYSSSSINIQGSADESVMIPLPVAQQIYRSGNTLHIIALTAKDGVKMSSLEDRIRSVIARNHTFDPTDKAALMVLNTEQMFSMIDNLFEGLRILVWIVGLGTILAGAIGISNILTVTVRERTVEIGIRRAIGATPQEILAQIIYESILLTLVSGLAGLVFGAAIMNAVASSTGIAEFVIPFNTALLTLLSICLLGVAAGMPPALRAMKIKPVDAMRDE